MKKTVAWILTVALCLCGAAAQAAPLAQAARLTQPERFAHYPSYTLDEQTGTWSVRTNAADALVERFWAEGAPYAGSLCVFTLDTLGNAATGVLTPVLRFYYRCGSARLEADAVSLLADGVRYDFAARSQTVKNGRAVAEVVTVPLTQEALSAVRTLSGAQELSLRLIGQADAYTTELDAAATGARSQIEAASLSGLTDALALLDAAGMDTYALWDLSAAAWEGENGYAPAFARTPVHSSIAGSETDDAFGMVLPGERTGAAKAARQALVEAGFLNAKAGTEFDASASAATRRAQRYLGRVENGCADAALIDALAADEPAPVAPVAPAAPEMDALAEVAEITLDRYWFAGAVSAANAQDAARAVSNTDNALLVADGFIRNLSQAELRLFMNVQAQVVYSDAYAYEAVLLCERDQGTALDTALVPLGQARLIVYAEVPAWLAQDADAAWRVEITADGQTLTYDLQ